jgi:hypothetical protein
MTIFFFLIPDATRYLSLIFDSLLDLGGFRGKSTYIQHPGTAEPFRIAPVEPVAYTNLVIGAQFVSSDRERFRGALFHGQPPGKSV